ncbi:hypothetical protein Lser_V15G35006 [Lactuca serriola]
MADASQTSAPTNTTSRFATLDTINTTSFDADQYMNLLVQKSNLEGLLQRHVEMAAEIKNLDTDLQMLVYENYNKFISATDTIKRDFCVVLDEELGLILKLRDMMIGWIHEGFQRFFRRLNDELLLQLGKGSCSYVNMRTQRISVLLKKRLTTPNWVKHKEPREVHMFVDMFLQELVAVGREVKQILGEGGGVVRKHARTESNGSTSSSRNNTNTNNNNRSNTNRARSQLLETHLAKLFKQKMEIFTKVQHTQVGICCDEHCETLPEKLPGVFVRLQTFNRSGFQQIQLDMQYLRTTLKDATDSEDEAALEFLLDEVIVAAAERCLDPSPLEPAILDRLVQLKLAR